MGIKMYIAALAAFVLGKFLKWYLTKNWTIFCGDARATRFPSICPVCLGEADAAVVEESEPRTTANYIVARKLEWWRVSVPHCSKCKQSQWTFELLGVLAGGVCAVIALIVTKAFNGDIMDMILCLVFAYPAYIYVSNLKMGAFFEQGDATNLRIRIRNRPYFDALSRANASPVVDAGPCDVPLAGGGGVWRRS